MLRSSIETGSDYLDVLNHYEDMNDWLDSLPDYVEKPLTEEDMKLVRWEPPKFKKDSWNPSLVMPHDKTKKDDKTNDIGKVLYINK